LPTSKFFTKFFIVKSTAANSVKFGTSYNDSSTCTNTSITEEPKTNCVLNIRNFSNKLYQVSGLLLLNARNLANKIPLLQVYAAKCKPLVIAVTETWATENIPNSVYNLNGFKLHRKDRYGQSGRGVCLYVSNRVNSDMESTSTQNAKFEESVWCNIFLPNKTKFLVGVIYRLPNCNPVVNQHLNELMVQALKLNSAYKLICDFNYPSIDWKNMVYPPSIDDFVDVVLDFI